MSTKQRAPVREERPAKALRQFASHNGGWFSAVVFANSLLAIGLMLPRKEDGLWPFLRALAAHAQSETSKSGNGLGPIVDVGNVNVMLHSGGSDHYVEANFALEMASETDRDVVGKRLSRIRETSIGCLLSMHPDDLRGSQGMEKAKALMLDHVRKAMPAQRFKAVYVTNLVVD